MPHPEAISNSNAATTPPAILADFLAATKNPPNTTTTTSRVRTATMFKLQSQDRNDRG
jgi:hypothetical protein